MTTVIVASIQLFYYGLGLLKLYQHIMQPARLPHTRGGSIPLVVASSNVDKNSFFFRTIFEAFRANILLNTQISLTSLHNTIKRPSDGIVKFSKMVDSVRRDLEDQNSIVRLYVSLNHCKSLLSQAEQGSIDV